MDTMPHILGFSFTGKYYFDFPTKLIIEKVNPKDLPIGIIFDESISPEIRKELSEALVGYYDGPRMFYYNQKLTYDKPFDEQVKFRDAYLLKPLFSKDELGDDYIPLKIKKESLQHYFGQNILSQIVDGDEYVYFYLYQIRTTHL